jgi:hypothetical protein
MMLLSTFVFRTGKAADLPVDRQDVRARIHVRTSTSSLESPTGT